MLSHYEQNENAFYQFVLSVNRVHGDSVNNRVARGEMTCFKGNGEFCFPETLSVRSRGNKIRCFQRDKSLSVFLYFPTQNWKKSVCLMPAGSEICRGFKEHGLITRESQVRVTFSVGSKGALFALGSQ